MISTKEILKTKIAMKANTASVHRLRVFNAFEPIRFTADATTAITAGIKP